MRLRRLAVLGLALGGLLAGCGRSAPTEPRPMSDASPPPADVRLATFGGGCFWCTEAVFSELDGVLSVTSGYSGGHVDAPDYRAVCSGLTGHAEVVQIEYDPARVSYTDLLEVFFRTHDPTTKDRQGHDVGTQYRSVVFWHDEAQRDEAQRVKEALDGSGAWDAPLVTEIVPFERFWPAEDYHQDYFRTNPEQPYCQAVIAPKLDKFRKAFADRLR